MTSSFGFILFCFKGIGPLGISIAGIPRPVIPYTLVELARMDQIILFPGSPFSCP